MPPKKSDDKERPSLREARAYIPEAYYLRIVALCDQERWSSLSSFLGMILMLGLMQYCRMRSPVFGLPLEPDLSDGDSASPELPQEPE